MNIHQLLKDKELVQGSMANNRSEPPYIRGLMLKCEKMTHGLSGKVKKETQLVPTGVLLWPETEGEGVQAWQPGPLETTETWTGLQAWRKERKTNTRIVISVDVKQNNNLFHLKKRTKF